MKAFVGETAFNLSSNANQLKQFETVQNKFCNFRRDTAALSLIKQRQAILANAQRPQSPVSQNILSVLKDELKYERESYRLEELIKDAPPFGFEVLNEGGSNVFYLQKRNGDENIVIAVDIQRQSVGSEASLLDDGDGEEDEEESETIKFTVNIAKKRKALVFEIESEGEYMVIQNLSVVHEDADEDSNEYTGPEFSSLDDTLQQAFLDFLEDRGVTVELAEYIAAFLRDKEALEYQTWLERVKDFILD